MIVPQRIERGALVMVGVVLDRSTPESFCSVRKSHRKAEVHPGLPSGRRRLRLFPQDQGQGTWRISTGSTAIN